MHSWKLIAFLGFGLIWSVGLREMSPSSERPTTFYDTLKDHLEADARAPAGSDVHPVARAAAGQLQLGLAFRRLGHPEAAIRLWRPLMGNPWAPPTVWTELARLHLENPDSPLFDPAEGMRLARTGIFLGARAWDVFALAHIRQGERELAYLAAEAGIQDNQATEETKRRCRHLLAALQGGLVRGPTR